MNFGFKLSDSSKGKSQSVPNPFAADSSDDESQSSKRVTPLPPPSKPLDYLRMKTLADAEKDTSRSVVEDSATASVEDDDKRAREALLKRRDLAFGCGSAPSRSSTIASSVNLKQAGLVKLGPSGEDGTKSESKHISRMVETAQVNEKFKNLLKVKVADRDKDKAEKEFGARPEEFITSSYLKQKEESLRLEKELEARESSQKKRDVTTLFREMLGSGNYTRTNFVDTSAAPLTNTDPSILSKITQDAVEPVEVTTDQVKKVLDKVVPEESKEVAKAVGENAKFEALRIIERLDQMIEPTEADREDVRKSAKERYLERKRLRLQNDS